MHARTSHPWSAMSILLIALPLAPAALAQNEAPAPGDTDTSAIARWATAAGGRDRIAAVRSVYREGTVQVAGFEGTIRAWHTAEGRYRKEEKIASYSAIEVFDGVKGTVRKGSAPPQKMAEAELGRAITGAYANWNSLFFVLFPERRPGSRAASGDSVVFRPEGGIDWRVTLDPQTSLPRVMEHLEGEHTVTVTFLSYETVDGIQFEKEIRRTSTGDPKLVAVIRFTKTVINPPVDASLFVDSETTLTAAEHR